MTDAEGGQAMSDAPDVIFASQARMAAMSSAPGVEVRPIFGQSLLTCWITMAPGAGVPTHSHINEQSGVVIGGSVTITVNGESRVLTAGEAYLVAPDVVHEGVAGPDGAQLVESFTPVQEDFREKWLALQDG
jgi:quercetin dioxygenase-like cupin family protein